MGLNVFMDPNLRKVEVTLHEGFSSRLESGSGSGAGLGESVEEEKIFRPDRRYRSAGSKSLNVARFLTRLGHEVHLIGSLAITLVSGYESMSC